ncbi:Homeobox domain-containing protein [Mycena indigotica]|uniref:Homeobox domain-containing protein n=1 Tax=Mycena indigotica TaxID=2126181 RepID=A0A8H6W9M2_9AGAR|nr:Homeobox domain-containing protein [Mycena indigotica]KAF7306768.1 Homeobox domain-containing protein [Mycena indigotica]
MTLTNCPLQLLADAASNHDSDESSRCPSPECPPHDLRPRKSKHHRVARRQVKTKLCPLDRHAKELKKAKYADACNIKTLSNSPANPFQLRMLRMVYDSITIYPPDNWQALLALGLYRSPVQIRNWFSNTRQKNRGDARKPFVDLGDGVKLRPSALSLSDEWSDETFEQILSACITLCSFRE